MTDQPALVTPAQAAALAGVSRQTVHTAIARGQLAYLPQQGHWLDRAAVEAWASRDKSRGGRPRKPAAPCTPSAG
jgi:hypothetical protein